MPCTKTHYQNLHIRTAVLVCVCVCVSAVPEGPELTENTYSGWNEKHGSYT